MKQYKLQNEKKYFKSLEKLFLTGERDKDIYGKVTEDGIILTNKLIYHKNESEEEYLLQNGFLDNKHYPLLLFGYLDDEVLQTVESVASDNEWLNMHDNYIDTLPDDNVLVSVDRHI